MKSTTGISAAVLLALSGSVESFTTTLSTSTTSSTRLNLLPAQGKQLEAALNAALAKAEAQKELCDEEEDECIPPTLDIYPKSAARSFVSRVFSLPSAIVRGSPDPKLEGPAVEQEEEKEDEVSLFEWDNKGGDDVVLFPLVGFQFVGGGQQVLPTTSNAACRLQKNSDEEVVGWFSKACHLNLHGDNYCEEPSNL